MQVVLSARTPGWTSIMGVRLPTKASTPVHTSKHEEAADSACDCVMLRG